ncbi:MAG TPA: Ig-like domain-containing protein [Gemmatimonadales bacterium]|nr:Ig-like domain-containing protein [Gemmatimonadales bacterium]
MAACPSITDSGYSLRVTPSTANLFVDDNLRLSATLTDPAGTSLAAPFTWSSDNPSVATVDTSGLVQGIAAGLATIRVTARGEQATASVTVVVDSGQTLTVTPATVSLFVDNTQRVTATVKDRHGNTIPSAPEWSSNNSAVATVDQTGLIRATGAGSATVQARVNGLVATTAVTVAPRPSSVVFVGAGDIATSGGGDESTAKLLDGISGTVFTLGDNAYPNGSATEYSSYYGPTWGRHKARTRPVPGNHEYNTQGAEGYYSYFGSAAGEPGKGYYSYDLGGWHIIALNSNLASNAGSPQEQWLRADLASSNARCTLAYWHHARFSSGTTHGNSLLVRDLWQALYEYGAEIVLSGHEHTYERFAPQTPDGGPDMSKGIRQFIVGTGGAGLYSFGATPRANSEVRHNSTRGVLKLTLHADRYEWQFVPASGSFTDSGSGSCH